MNELSTKVKKDKLNIFQKIRLELFKRNTRNNPEKAFEKYKNAPDYIRNNEMIAYRIMTKLELTEEELLEIPETILLNGIRSGRIKIENFSLEQQVEFFKKDPLTLFGYHKEEERNAIIYQIIMRGDYSFIQTANEATNLIAEQNILEKLKEQGMLEDILPEIIQYLSDGKKIGVLEHRPMLLTKLSEEEQVRIFSNDPKMFQYADVQIQLRYIDTNPEYASRASREVREIWVNKDINNITKLIPEHQIEIVSQHPEMYKNISYEAQQMIENLDTPECTQATISMLRHDIRNSKLIGFLEKQKTKLTKESLYGLFEGLEGLDDETLKNTILHSKMMSAIGKLSKEDYVFHGITGGEEIRGIDAYEEKQIEIMQRLSVEQISQLVRIDSNYILPYLAGKKVNTLTNEESVHSNWRCKTLFIEMFGREKFEQFEHCIEMVYDMQSRENETIAGIHHAGLGQIRDYDKFMRQGEIPLEEFKLLFNEAVVSNNSPEQIEAYLSGKMKGEDAGELFRGIIGRAYGENAKAILESRPNLNVHSINSIEVFDPRILGVFGEAFVHDAISYNLRDFSEFLEVSKNSDKRESFKTYYEALTAIYGQNVETMQKAISEYYYVEELLTSAKDVELTDKQYSNLISVICSIKNPLNISTLQELQNYDEIANNELKRQMEGYIKSTGSNGVNINVLREMISQNFFGMRYSASSNTPYGTSLSYINQMYDLQEDEREKSFYTDAERKMLQILEFIGNELNVSKLLELTNALMQEQGIRNPMALQTAITKTREEQTNILNNSLTGIEKMEQLCSEQEADNPNIYKEIIDGVTIYHLNGVPYTFLAHDIGENARLEDIMEYEGQAGNTAICSRVIRPNQGSISQKLLYSQVDEDMLISSDTGDAGTQHISKRVKNIGDITVKAKNIPQISTTGNEVAFYRRYRKHEKVQNNNQGGRRKPDAYGIYASEAISDQVMEFCKKYGIPIVVVHSERYQEKEEMKEEETK